jgi:hypothetical protein
VALYLLLAVLLRLCGPRKFLAAGAPGDAGDGREGPRQVRPGAWRGAQPQAVPRRGIPRKKMAGFAGLQPP